MSDHAAQSDSLDASRVPAARAIRIGAVGYLNARPLTWALDRAPEILGAALAGLTRTLHTHNTRYAAGQHGAYIGYRLVQFFYLHCRLRTHEADLFLF